MVSPQRLPASLTPLETALAAVLRGLTPVEPIALPLAEALHCIAAEMPPLAAHPPHDIAAGDGWALRAHDLVGASSYSPVLLAAAPAWVEAGEAMPAGCDCVLDADLVEVNGAIAQVLAEAIPGQGVRRKGQDIAEGGAIAEPGSRLSPRDLLLARAAGIGQMKLRRPRLHIVNTPGATVTGNLIAESARCAGAEVTIHGARARDAAAVAEALNAACDLLVTVGGSGVGRTDAAVAALAMRGEVIAHGIALQPGRTAAIGRIATTPVIVLPGAPDQAFAAWWALALPMLDRLLARLPRRTISLPLSRKIASLVGIAEVVLLKRDREAWLPLAVGDLSLDAIARADAFLIVPGGSEGFAAGMAVDAYMLEE